MVKNRKLLRELSFLLMVISLFISCASDKDASQPQKTFPEYKNSFAINCLLTTSTGTQNLSGYAVIDFDNSIEVNFEAGILTGTSHDTEDGYNVSFISSDGMFRNISNVAGTINQANQTINLSGTNINGTSILFSGTLSSLMGGDDNYLQQWGLDHTKSAFVFQNFSTCTASITLDGTTLNGVTPGYWNTRGQCVENSFLRSMRPINVETEDSRVLCHTLTLLSQTGSGYVDFEECHTAKFIVDKDVSYNYTVEWANGTTTTGTTGKIVGGRENIICIAPQDESNQCDTSSLGAGQGKIFYNGLLETGTVHYEVFQEASCSPTTLYEVSIVTQNFSVAFLKLPSGQPTVNLVVNDASICDAQFGFSNSQDIYAINNVEGFNGVFQWTSSTSFGYNCSWTKNGQNHSVVGEGIIP